MIICIYMYICTYYIYIYNMYVQYCIARRIVKQVNETPSIRKRCPPGPPVPEGSSSPS